MIKYPNVNRLIDIEILPIKDESLNSNEIIKILKILSSEFEYMPNSILIDNLSDSYYSEFINFIRYQSNSRFIKLYSSIGFLLDDIPGEYFEYLGGKDKFKFSNTVDQILNTNVINYIDDIFLYRILNRNNNCSVLIYQYEKKENINDYKFI